MVQSISKPTRDEAQQLYELAKLGMDGGLTDGVRWLMSAMKKATDSSRSGRRRRTVSLIDGAGRPVRAGRFKVPTDVLERAEVIE